MPIIPPISMLPYVPESGAQIGLLITLVIANISSLSTEAIIEFFMQTFIVLTGIVGQLLVIKKNVAGFWFWVASNVAMAVASAFKGYYGMVILYVFYIFMCFYGLREWKLQPNINSKTAKPTQTERIDPE